MKYYQENFNDNCYELTILRWFRDNFVSKDDIEHYYEVAPMIVEAINKDKKIEIIYDYIYENVVEYCIEQIIQGKYEIAYNRYKNSILALEEQFVKSTSNKEQSKKNKNNILKKHCLQRHLSKYSNVIFFIKLLY